MRNSSSWISYEDGLVSTVDNVESTSVHVVVIVKELRRVRFGKGNGVFLSGRAYLIVKRCGALQAGGRPDA